MKIIIFDSSTIISIISANLLEPFSLLRKKFDGKFMISESVKQEIVDNPIMSKRFKLEALMLNELIRKNYIEVYKGDSLRQKALYLLNLANNIYKIKGDYLKILHLAEVESLVLCMHLNADALAIDERTTRLLIEDPDLLLKFLKNKLHTKVSIDYQNLNKFKKEAKDITIIRSVELILVAYKMKLLDRYINYKLADKNLRKELIEGILWGLKLHGCSLTEQEIEEVLVKRNL